jgi:hypothetical protein
MKPIVASHYQQVVEEIETVTLSLLQISLSTSINESDYNRDGPHHWEDSNLSTRQYQPDSNQNNQSSTYGDLPVRGIDIHSRTYNSL